MRPAEEYRGREQTFLKHFFLEKYLERVAYNIGSFATDFVYVDGFSGPWRSTNESFEDTSFMIAIRTLRVVRDGIRARPGGKDMKIRCLFIEKDAEAFKTLQAATADISDMKVTALRGSFEDLVPEIVNFVGQSFALTFIDPTGWRGFALKKITPVLQLRGEVLVNFMVNHITRFADDDRSEIAESFHDLFGGSPPTIPDGARRDDVLAAHYATALKDAGKFKHSTFTRILWPLQDRVYFHLVYGTGHPKGLLEFRSTEKRLFGVQNEVRAGSKQTARIAKTGQTEMFGPKELPVADPLEDHRAEALRDGAARVTALLQDRKQVTYSDLIAVALELPLYWESDLQDLLANMRKAGSIEVNGMNRRERTFKDGHVIVAKG